MSASRSGALREIIDSNFRVIAKPCCALFGVLRATERFDVVNGVDQGQRKGRPRLDRSEF